MRYCPYCRDSYIVQGEHEHRRLKVRRKRTNFINPDQQMVKMDIRESAIRRIAQELVSVGIHVAGVELEVGNSDTHAPESTGTTPILPSEHHSVAKSERNVLYLRPWQLEYPDDDAVQVSIILKHPAISIRSCMTTGICQQSAGASSGQNGRNIPWRQS